MKFLLDTNAVICMMKGTYGVRERILEAGLCNCYVSEITIAELLVGYFKTNKNEKQLQEVHSVQKLFKVLPISPALAKYAETRVYLEGEGKRIDDFDMLIGCTALVNDCIVVTHNKKHFERIPQLVLEDWETR